MLEYLFRMPDERKRTEGGKRKAILHLTALEKQKIKQPWCEIILSNRQIIT